MSERTNRTERFTFLCTPPERRLLYALADLLDRSQGDTVRWLIRIAGQEFSSAQQSEVEAQPETGDTCCLNLSNTMEVKK